MYKDIKSFWVFFMKIIQVVCSCQSWKDSIPVGKEQGQEGGDVGVNDLQYNIICSLDANFLVLGSSQEGPLHSRLWPKNQAKLLEYWKLEW